MRRLAILTLLAVSAWGAESEERAARRRFQSVAAQANAYRKVVEHLEQRLADMGLTLHPELSTTRTRMEMCLDRAEDLLAERDWKAAEEEIERARAYLLKLSKSI